MSDHHESRKTIRLQRISYAEHGAYFLTLVTHDRIPLFGEIENGEVKISQVGLVVRGEWVGSATMRPHLVLDEFVIMPNHLHAIVGLAKEDPSARSAALRTSRDRAPASISSFIAGFKAATTRRIREHLRNPHFQVWQPRFHDHVIRDDRDFDEIREYIHNNPVQWEFDQENPDHS